MSHRTPTRLNEDGDLEKQCGICGDWWYFDDEFFNRNVSGNLASPCKACCIEIRRRIAEKPCSVAGCPLPRYGRVSSYCREHHYQIHLGRTAPARKAQKPRKLRNQNYY